MNLLTSGSANNISEVFNSAELGVLSKIPGFTEELAEVQRYYQFFEGFDINDIKNETPYGQMWKTSDAKMDYTPTKEIRNHTKKLLKKQSRFMFGIPPKVLLNPTMMTGDDGEVTDDSKKELKAKAEDKRTLIDMIFQDSNFWGKTAAAFLDTTIGKRSLLFIHANADEPIRFTYYTMPEFYYEVDPNDSSRITKVTIVYQDERTRGKDVAAQLWHQYSYEMRRGKDNTGPATQEPTAWYTYRLTDGTNTTQLVEVPTDEEGKSVKVMDPLTQEEETILLEVQEDNDTGFSQIPCHVILNDPLTGDIYGSSDIKDLMGVAESYNRTVSDYRDALRFKMFEQAVFIDASNNSMKDLKIAPNTAINLKTDARRTMGQNSGSVMAQVTTLSSNFNFSDPADSFLDRAKKDMYELMDQPLPEKLQDAPSAKAIKFLFYDLMARCEEKWGQWEPAIVWAIQFMEEATVKLNLYPEKEGKALFSTPTMITLEHNYPLPEDDDARKAVAIQEVQAQAMSRKTYIRTYGTVEDEKEEFADILKETGELEEVTTGGMFNMQPEEPEDPADPKDPTDPPEPPADPEEPEKVPAS